MQSSKQVKHVLVVTSVYPRHYEDNYGSFVQETILRCQDDHLHFTVFAPTFEGCPTNLVKGIKVHRFRYCLPQYENLTYAGAPTKIQKPLYKLVSFFYILLGSIQLFLVCAKERPHLLHVHWPFPHGLMAYPASLLLKIPMVFTFHGAELLLMRKFSYVGSILRWLTPKAQGVTVNSSFTQKLVEEVYDGPVEIIPYGLTIEPKPSIPRAPEELPTLLFVGRLIERKGVTYLLEALPHVLAQHPVRLRIVGKGAFEDELKAQCNRLGLNDHVDFVGYLTKEELAEEYACCSLFVLPAIVDSKGDTEGLGIVMIEALAHAKPLVATDVGGISDVISSGITGMLVPQREPLALAEAINQVLSDKVFAEQMGEQGRRDVMSRFGWKRIVPLWQSLFNRALSTLPDPLALPIGKQR
jgi:glycosyltransferase involved in cell wall biosynthesis